MKVCNLKGMYRDRPGPKYNNTEGNLVYDGDPEWKVFQPANAGRAVSGKLVGVTRPAIQVFQSARAGWAMSFWVHGQGSCGVCWVGILWRNIARAASGAWLCLAFPAASPAHYLSTPVLA